MRVPALQLETFGLNFHFGIYVSRFLISYWIYIISFGLLIQIQDKSKKYSKNYDQKHIKVQLKTKKLEQLLRIESVLSKLFFQTWVDNFIYFDSSRRDENPETFDK